MRKWYIYKTTNLVTGKSYVGQSCKPLNIYYMGSGKYFLRSYNKYGYKNFKKEILKADIGCETAANYWEIYYIKKENTLHPNGYNLTTGGFQKLPSDISRKRMSESARNKPPATDEYRKNISDGLKNMPEDRRDAMLAKRLYAIQNSPPFKGKHHTEESNELNRQKHLGKKHSEEAKRKTSESLKKYWLEKKIDKMVKI